MGTGQDSEDSESKSTLKKEEQEHTPAFQEAFPSKPHINPAYDDPNGHRLIAFLIQRGMLKREPEEPEGAVFIPFHDPPVMRPPVNDYWPTNGFGAWLYHDLLKLQSENPKPLFKDLLTKEESSLVGDVTKSVVAKKVSGDWLDEIELGPFAQQGLNTSTLHCQPEKLLSLSPMTRSEEVPTNFAIQTAMSDGYNSIVRITCDGSSLGEYHPTLKGYAFCFAVHWYLVQNELIKEPCATRKVGLTPFRAWIQSPLEYFQVPQPNSLRWCSWVAEILFSILHAGDEWAWREFSDVANHVGWCRSDSTLLQHPPPIPAKNERYLVIREAVLAELPASRRAMVAEWFQTLESNFSVAISDFKWRKLDRVLALDFANFVLPYALLRLRQPVQFKYYRRTLREYLRKVANYMKLDMREDAAYDFVRVETLSGADPWYWVVLNWEIWIGSDRAQRKSYPVSAIGKRRPDELRKELLRPCLPLIRHLHRMGVRKAAQRGMALCNALVQREVYKNPTVFKRDIVRAIEE